MENLKAIKDKYFKIMSIKNSILPNGEELTWINIVKYADTFNINLADFNYLAIANKFRKEMVDAILKYSLILAECQNECIIESVGSTKLSSDYDVTVSGNNSDKVEFHFMKLFGQLFNYESSIIFDTNIYATAFYEPAKNINEQSFNDSTVLTFFPYKSDIEGVHYIKYLDISKDANIIADQRIWAYIAFIRFLNAEDISYVKAHLNDANLRLLVAAIEKNKILDRYLPNVTGNKQRDHNLISNSQKYSEKVREVKISYEHLLLNNSEASRRDYQNKISTANYYANESYLTRGAFFHVVGHLQSKIYQLPISKEEYIDSYIENLSNTFKVIAQFKVNISHVDETKESSSKCLELIIEMSKYYYRAIDALYNICLIDKLDNQVLKDVNQLRLSLLDLAKNIRGNTICDNKNSDDACISLKTVKSSYTKFLQLDKISCDNPKQYILEIFVENINFF